MKFSESNVAKWSQINSGCQCLLITVVAVSMKTKNANILSSSNSQNKNFKIVIGHPAPLRVIWNANTFSSYKYCHETTWHCTENFQQRDVSVSRVARIQSRPHRYNLLFTFASKLTKFGQNRNSRRTTNEIVLNEITICNYTTKYEILGYQRGFTEDSSLPRCYAATLGKQFLTFRKILVTFSKRQLLLDCLARK